MKNVVAYLIFLLEMAGIIAVCVILGNEYARHFATVVPIPDGMKLTFEKDFEVDTRDGALLIPEGMVIIPEEIFPNKVVVFSYEGYERLRAEGEYFKEKDQFEPLLAEAEHNHEEAVLKNKILYIAIGIAIAAGWLVIGGLLTKLSIKHSCVDNIIIDLHGSKHALQPAYPKWIYADDKEDGIKALLSNCSKIRIKNIDFQSCFAGYYNSEFKSVAVETLKASGAEAVYAATGELIYEFKCNQVFGGAYYKFFINDKGEIIRQGGKIIFDVMYRWRDEHIPYIVLSDYPTHLIQ